MALYLHRGDARHGALHPTLGAPFAYLVIGMDVTPFKLEGLGRSLAIVPLTSTGMDANVTALWCGRLLWHYTKTALHHLHCLIQIATLILFHCVARIVAFFTCDPRVICDT